MNKGMIIVGILLLAGLSFAYSCPPHQYSWQDAVTWRYHCNYYMGEENYGTAEYMYTYGQPYISWTSLYNLNGALGNMNGYFGDMCEGDYYATNFRADMLNYNSQSSAFNTIFNAVLRTYLAHADAGGRAYVLGWLRETRGEYMSCITPK